MYTLKSMEDEADLESSGTFYLSSVSPENLQQVAQIMYDNGETDDTIGKLVKHYIHDYQEDRGVDLMFVKHDKTSGVFGTVSFIPNEVWYAKLFDEETLAEHAAVQVRTYAVSNVDSIRTPIDERLFVKGMSDEPNLLEEYNG